MSRLFRLDFLKWFYPGMHIKRWLALMVIGVAVMTFGLAYILREAYISGFTFPGFMYYVTLQFISRYIRGAMFMAGAGGLIVFSMWKLNQSIVSALAPHRDTTESLVNVIYNQRFLRRGPRIVAVGGGTGLSTLLRGLKEYTGNLTAIVTVADDGGSSGVLRRELGVLPPGDVRNCIAALADAEPLMTKLFQYRFSDGSGLAGHSFGNLFIVAMSGVVGNFEDAIRQTSRVLAVRGQIIPSTLANVTLCAKMTDARTIEGESSIGNGHGRIRQVYLMPENPPAHPEAVRAILEADMIVLGPGSLYTSVLPNLLVQGVRRALSASSAVKVYVCNVATQPGETDGFGVRDHLAVIEEHVGRHLIDFVLANDNVSAEIERAAGSEPVRVDAALHRGIRLLTADVVSEENRYHHDSKKLAEAIMRIYYDRDQVVIPSPEEGSLVSALDQ
ncbi:MAG TPA: gluconeogenesis factor YvcK family protein, partial [Dehalococcoidia bacterium]|nr:gluconeogenesis factor YvcK family protein [Dehalococcoidia bacterium]